MIPSESAIPKSITPSDLGRGPNQVPSNIVEQAGYMAANRKKISPSVSTVTHGIGKEAFNKISTDATNSFASGAVTKYNEEGLKEWEQHHTPKRETIKIDSSK